MSKAKSTLTMIDEMSQEEFDNWDGSDELAISGPDIAGVAEAADIFKVTKQAVVNWRNRYPDFPKPYAMLSTGPIYHKSALIAWGKKHGKL